jgi:hypothetical protein
VELVLHRAADRFGEAAESRRLPWSKKRLQSYARAGGQRVDHAGHASGVTDADGWKPGDLWRYPKPRP